jgi:TonB-dependent receptor
MIVDLYRFGSRIASVFILILVFSLQTSIFAQSGSIKGIVFDKDSKEPLVGADIIIKGTSLGAASDLDGAYSIKNIAAGRHTFIISYIGYNSDTVVLSMSANKELIRNFYLSANSIQGQTIVITGQAQGQVAAIQEQLSSNKIVNVVSEEKIQELPDFNAAAAIGRLPGVSTTQSSGEAQKVVIRGLAPQYNEIAIGGIMLASTGSTSIGATSQGGGSGSGQTSNDRSVDLTMVTPYMIKDIEVYKALLPDMEANAIGGYVNMELREAPSGLHGDLLWQSGYTNFENKYSNYRAVASASDRFFNDMLGVYVLGNAESYDRNDDVMNASYSTNGTQINPSTGFRDVVVANISLDRHIETRNRYGGNVILDYTLPNGSITSVNMFSRLNANYQDYKQTMQYTGNASGLAFTYGSSDANTDLAVNSLEAKNDFGFILVDLKVANSYSFNNNPNSPYEQFNDLYSVNTNGNINKVPEDLLNEIQYNPAVPKLVGSSLFSSQYKENDQVYKGDFKIPLNIENTVSGFFKFGGQFRFNYHNNEQNTPYIQIDHGQDSINSQSAEFVVSQFPQLSWNAQGYFPASEFTSNNGSLRSSFLNNKFGSMLWAANGGLLDQMTNAIANDPLLNGNNPLSGSSSANPGGWQDGLYQYLTNDYIYIERYYASYLMSELDFGQNLMVVGGARFEQVNGQYTAYNLVDVRNPSKQQFDTDTITSYTQNHFWLPQVQVKYTPSEWLDLRYAYTQTIARPDYSAISPHFNISNNYNSVYAGNPDLVPAQAYNHDLEITFHSNDLGLITIGGFYKTIKNFSYSTSYNLFNQSPAKGFDSVNSFMINSSTKPNLNSTLYTYINDPYKAYVKGVEIDYQTRLWYLPFPLDGLVLGINYAHIASSTNYPLFDTKTVNNPKPPPKFITAFVDTVQSGRLVDQPNDLVNAYIGYDYKGFSGRFSFLFQGNSVSSISNYPEGDGFTRNYFRIDASFKQELPVPGLDIFLDFNNLNDEANISTQTTIGGFTNEDYYGMTADFGIRYKL